MSEKAPPNMAKLMEEANAIMGPYDLPDRPPLRSLAYAEQIALARQRIAAPLLYDALSAIVHHIRDGRKVSNTSPLFRIACEALLAARGERP